MLKRMRNFPLAAAAAVLFLGAMLIAQTSAGGLLVGVITDPSGAAVPGATAQVTNTGTNAALTTHTDAHGAYSFASLAPGTYRLTAAATGFRTAAISNLNVEVAKTNNANLKLVLGQASQTVEVSAAAAAAQLQTLARRWGTWWARSRC